MRSRAVSLPRLCCASMRAAPPPRRACSRRCSSLSRMSFIRTTLVQPRLPDSLGIIRQKPYHSGGLGGRRGPDGLPNRDGSGRKPGMNATPSKDPSLQEALELHREGEHEEAMERYVALLQRNPGNVDALYYVAMIAIQQEQFAEGIKVIERALALEPPAGRGCTTSRARRSFG